MAAEPTKDGLYQDPTDCLMSQIEMEEMIRVRGAAAPYSSSLAVTLKKADAALTHGELLQKAVTPTPGRRHNPEWSMRVSPPTASHSPTSSLERKRRSRSLDDLLKDMGPQQRHRLSAVSIHSSPGTSPRNSPPSQRRSFRLIHAIDLPARRPDDERPDAS